MDNNTVLEYIMAYEHVKQGEASIKMFLLCQQQYFSNTYFEKCVIKQKYKKNLLHTINRPIFSVNK